MIDLVKIVLAVTLVLKCVLSANILIVSSLASPSHYLWNKEISLSLIERGHNITILTHDGEKIESPKNFTVITLEGLYGGEEYLDFDVAMTQGTLYTIKALYDYVTFVCEYDLKTKGLETFLNYPEDYKFDLIMFDVTFGQCLYPLIERFNNPPVVAITAFLLPPYLSHSFGNHLYTSYMPYYNSDFTNKMSLTERALNFLYTYIEIYYRNYIISSREHNLAKKRFGENIREFAEVERSMTLLLANTDSLLNYPMALPPNIIPIGGIHIRAAKPLPEDLKTIVEGAKHGVILFSLGTNIHFEMLKPEQRQALFDALAKFPQIVLWKIISERVEGLPKNVIIRKWLPQNDILGHPNTKLFISHGGALSTQEAMYHGVPVVVIPFIIDQHINARKLVDRNLGKCLNQKNLTSENVYNAVNEVLSNRMYRENMKTLSERYRDQPETPLQRGIFWIEYMLRHGTAEHLVLPARDMPFYQTSNLDVMVIFALCLFFAYNLLMLVITGCRFLLTFNRRDTHPKSSK